MKITKPYQQHLLNSNSLVTTDQAIRAGFVNLALEKNRIATPFVAQAKALKVAASLAKVPTDLLDIDNIQSALLTAAGVSDKAKKYLENPDQVRAIQELIKKFLEPAGADFINELIFRFLLIRGDTLGGLMRNIAGILAQRKLNRFLISSLRISGKSYQILNSLTNTWVNMSNNDDADIELSLKGLSWEYQNSQRTIIYNLTVPLVKNNVDVCLLNCHPQQVKSAIKLPSNYLALGELKGGIDPAGADEHWKTARTALQRIQKAFSSAGYTPQIFFLGGAIEKKMATEIWHELEIGILANAANLTDDDQLASLAHWLCNI